jgi:uncharacterized protein YbjT (DUF2867 family)
MATSDDKHAGGDVVVIGRPDRQAGAAARRLLARGAAVRLLSGPASPAQIEELHDLGAEVLEGSLDDQRDLGRALAGAAGLFLVLDQTDAGPSGRLQRGRLIGRAARAAGIEHVVFASSTGPDHHLVSCDLGDEVESHLRSLGLTVTVLRPATLMEEIPGYWLSRLGGELVLAAPFPPEEHLPMICSDDVGALAALALADEPRLRGQTVRVAGDLVTMAGVAASLSEVLAEPVRAEEVQVEGVFMVIPAAEEMADVTWLRGIYPGLRTLDEWLHDAGGRQLCERAVGRVAA